MQADTQPFATVTVVAQQKFSLTPWSLPWWGSTNGPNGCQTDWDMSNRHHTTWSCFFFYQKYCHKLIHEVPPKFLDQLHKIVLWPLPSEPTCSWHTAPPAILGRANGAIVVSRHGGGCVHSRASLGGHRERVCRWEGCVEMLREERNYHQPTYTSNLYQLYL